MDHYKSIYDTLLEEGELKRVSSKLSGDWEKDKKIFIQKQKEQEDLLGI